MAEWSHESIMLTKKGAEALSKVQTGKGYLTITRAVASSDVFEIPNLPNVTHLEAKLDLAITARTESGDGGSIISLQLSNAKLQTAFVLNTIGVYATHSDAPDIEFLYIISQVNTGTGDRIPAFNVTPVTANYHVYLYNLKASDIEVTITASGLATVGQLNDVKEELSAADQALAVRVGILEESATLLSHQEVRAIEMAIRVLTDYGLIAHNELDKWKHQRVQAGEVMVYNKYVMKGAIVNAIAGTRNIQVTETGEFSEVGASIIYIDGQQITIMDDKDSVAAIPKNPTSSPLTCYAFVGKDSSGKPKVQVSWTPSGVLKLARIVIPAGDMSENLDNVQIYDERRIEADGTTFYYNSRPFATVELPGYSMIDSPDYDVAFSVVSASNRNLVGGVYAYDKTANGFKVGVTGVADNIRIRYTVLNPDV